MRILLDTKDVVDLVERSKPASIEEVGHILREGEHQLVLSYVNVTELTSPLRKGVPFVDVRPVLITLESLPVCYIRESMIPGLELAVAGAAFDRNSTPGPIEPYVNRWDQVITPFGDSVMRPFVNLRLWEIVWTLFKQHALPDFKRESDALRSQFKNERALLEKAKVSKREIFVGAVTAHLKTYRIKSPSRGTRHFAESLYENPGWCPAHRIAFEIYHAVLRNHDDIPKDSDILDFNHLNTVPYVDALTLDRRMNAYANPGYPSTIER